MKPALRLVYTRIYNAELVAEQDSSLQQSLNTKVLSYAILTVTVNMVTRPAGKGGRGQISTGI